MATSQTRNMVQTFHKFKAESLDQAYKAMRRKLGDDAIVVRTATVTEGGVLGFMGRKMVEVTASSSENEERPRRLSPVEKRYMAAVPGTRSAGSAATPSSAKVEHYKEIIRNAQRRMGTGDEHVPQPAPPVAAPARPPARAPEKPAARTTSRAVKDELRELREMLSVLTAETPGPGLPEEYMPQYRVLLDRGIDRVVAADLVNAAAKGIAAGSRDAAKVFRERLKMEVRRSLSTTDGIALTPGKCHVAAVVGPTGVGKTTNLAKLAANYAVQEHAKVGVITADTYRVAATDQLRVYANIIDLDMKVANDAAEMAEAIRDFRDYDLVLIDTAGGSPYNQIQMDDIDSVLAAAHPDEIMLVLSASTPLEDLRGIVTQFSKLKPTSILFTKLDETRRCGPLYCLAAETRLPMSYFSIGQNVPDDVVLANVGTVANMVVEGGNQRGRSGAETS